MINIMLPKDGKNLYHTRVRTFTGELEGGHEKGNWSL